MSGRPTCTKGRRRRVTALMAVGIKAAAFAAFARVFLHHFEALAVDWRSVLWIARRR